MPAFVLNSIKPGWDLSMIFCSKGSNARLAKRIQGWREMPGQLYQQAVFLEVAEDMGLGFAARKAGSLTSLPHFPISGAIHRELA